MPALLFSRFAGPTVSRPAVARVFPMAVPWVGAGPSSGGAAFDQLSGLEASDGEAARAEEIELHRAEAPFNHVPRPLGKLLRGPRP